MASRKNHIKCIYCSKLVPPTAKGTIKPHIVHPGAQCVGNGASAAQMANQRARLDQQAKSR